VRYSKNFSYVVKEKRGTPQDKKTSQHGASGKEEKTVGNWGGGGRGRSMKGSTPMVPKISGEVGKETKGWGVGEGADIGAKEKFVTPLGRKPHRHARPSWGGGTTAQNSVGEETSMRIKSPARKEVRHLKK